MVLDRVQYSLYPVIYDRDEQHRIINEMIRNGTNRHLMQMKTQTEREILDPLTVLMIALDLCLIFFKDISFKEEQEWRTVAMNSPGEGVPIKFRSHPWYPMPYTEMKFDPGQLPLVEVKCGPAPEPGLATRSVKTLLGENGYQGVSVSESEIPLRW